LHGGPNAKIGTEFQCSAVGVDIGGGKPGKAVLILPPFDIRGHAFFKFSIESVDLRPGSPDLHTTTTETVFLEFLGWMRWAVVSYSGHRPSKNRIFDDEF
jgi:hypothetical protein